LEKLKMPSTPWPVGFDGRLLGLNLSKSFRTFGGDGRNLSL